MIIFTIFSVFILFIQILTFEVYKMNPFYQLKQQEFEFHDVEFSQNDCFIYGMWSKYNPLSIISQVGNIGLFDSTCFHLHNIIDKSSQSLNLIYYDCIDYKSQVIKKTIEFVNENDMLYQFEITIEPLEYENIWYYLEIIEWPAQLNFDFHIFSEGIIRIHEIKRMQRPFSDTNVILRFGGDLIVTNSKIPSLKTERKFSYFPGFIMIQELSKQTLEFDIDLIEIAQNILEIYGTCYCDQNDNFQIANSQLDWLDKQIYISKNTNCDSFILSGWFKINNIISITDEFIYKFLLLSANFENSFSNQNLSPFQMSYQISSEGNKILLTTYKYIFPIVSIDFQDDSFLLKKEFSITNSITLWHNIFVNLQENLLQVFINFYEGDVVYEYNVQLNVNQFNCIQFKLQFGNLLQSTTDYLNIDVQNLVFLNCNEQFQQQNCHFSCKDCDGPTKYNCLSCESQRIFIPEQKVCVCPYDSVDEQTCKTYLDSDFKLIEGNKQQFNGCQYGYFEYQGDCFKCPSIIRDNVLNCLECLSNPKEWYKKPFCMNDLYLDNDGGTQQEIYKPTPYFFLDGIEVTLCIFCQHTTFSSLEDQYLDFLYQNLNFKSFCHLNDLNYFQCYECQISFCRICYLSIQGHQCLKCSYGKKLVNGKCIDLYEIDLSFFCRSPSYITSKKKCSLCPISNCKYCFEYQTSDLTKSTLYKNFKKFDEGEEFKVGCALCEQNFIFNFNTGRCIYQKSTISNCLRSFINLDHREVCTLSEIDDFTIAPEIANCQKYLPNCLQCLLSPESTLKCIICQEGYTSSVINGDCYKNEFSDSKIVIEGDINLRDGWVQRIQSFMMQFLPNKYFYPKSDLNYYIREMIVECHQGYREVGSSTCEKYCDSQCLQCKTNQDGPYCAKCPLNYYQQPIRDQQNGECSECSQLCQICQSRTLEEIYNIQPSYILDGSNQLFTKKCLKPVNNPNILYDPYLQISKYCFESNCLNQIYYQVKFTYCGGFFVFWPFGFDYGINIKYCNQMGIDTLTIIYKFQTNNQFCGLRFILAASNLLKSKIFSLRNMYFQLISVERLMIQTFYSIEISYFDKIELNNVAFNDLQKMFIIQNNNSLVDIKLIDFSFEQCDLQNILSLFHNQLFGNIEAYNFSLLDSTFINSSILNLYAFRQNGIIIIKTLMIFRCIFKDSTLFLFGNSNFNIQIQDLIIEQCEFQNSTLFMFYDNLRNLTFLTIHNLTIQGSIFNHSSLIQNAHLVQLNLYNLQIIKNNLFQSNIISFNYHLNLNISLIQQNYFIESQVLKWAQTVSEQRVNIKINDVFIQFNSFKNSSLFLLYSSQLNNIYLDLSNIYLEDNYILSNINDEIALFIIQCHQLCIQNAKFINNNDLIIFKIYSSYSIQIENILYENSIQAFKVPLSLDCNNQMNQINQLFRIIGFFDLKILNVQVIKQLNVDSTFIYLSSSQEFQVQKIGTISIQNILFKQNLQISKQQYNLMSLLIIHAENELRITLNNVNFIENFVHSQVDSTLKYAASLMLINTQTSSIKITNMQSNNNGFTNSTNSFINIKSYKILIINLTITNHNILTQEIWQKYYDIQLDKYFNQDNLNNLIIQILKISNIGGAFQITSSDFYCLNCNFTNILAQRSSILQINTIKEGLIKLDQIQVSQVSNNIQLISNSSGCISINSQNSLLNLEITNTLFSNIVNRMASSIFTIFPSLIQNKISLQNIQIQNCISLMNQFLYLQFSPQNIRNNLFMIFNLTIIQKQEEWIQYLSNIIPLSESEIAEITGQTNALIYIENCQIIINGIIIEGLYISKIMKFINVIKLLLFNTYLQDIQLFYPCNIIEVDQDLGIKNIISFKQVQILRIQLLKLNQNIQKPTLDIYQVKDCKLFWELPKYKQIIFDISSIQDQFFKLSQDSLSIMQIHSISNENQITFQQIKIYQIDCSFCNNGLIYFNLENINYLKLQDVSCIQNYILSYGCLFFTQKDQLNVKISILNSNFYNNTGSKGVGITALNSSLIINSCKILRNLASTYGGGLYLDLNNNSFIFNQSMILNNQAKYGGGIYLNGEQNLNKGNFRQTILLFNKAQNYADNLIESPTHLTLYINQIEMQSSYIEQNNNDSQKNILKIQPYVIIEQEQQYNAQYLMLPSGQQIKDYEIILPKSLKTLFYIKEIGLYFKNSRNEQLLNLINSTCNINSVIQLNDDKIKESSYKATIDFDIHKNNFDLSQLSIIFDPYDQKSKYLQIDATCKVGLQNKTLNYLFNIKSLKCQLGEFYTNQGCQKCIASQGFYSVTYDTIKCSIFDKSKFSKITSNQINLLEGYWRPHYLSDYTSYCYKNQDFCIGGWKYGNNLCFIGHIGALCEECDLQNIIGNGKYYKNQNHLECLICQDQINSFASFILVFLWY